MPDAPPNTHALLGPAFVMLCPCRACLWHVWASSTQARTFCCFAVQALRGPAWSPGGCPMHCWVSRLVHYSTSLF